MFRKRKLIRIAAIFFALEMLADIALPHVALALTSGPTAPEATSFEPVDTTDMVNLATGDFNYNIPIFEVPGPAGGYPLNLSYHAGIKTNQEASWVGLGWTLNPGAINRSINGFPDDSKNSDFKSFDYSDGGTRTIDTYNLGLSIADSPIGLDLSFGTVSDTYEGVSQVRSIGISVDPFYKAPTKINGFVTEKEKISPFRLRMGASNEEISMSASLNSPFGSVGASLSSGGKSFSTYSSGTHSAKNTSRLSSYSKQKTDAFGWGLSFGRSKFYTRYWKSETAVLNGWGSLYMADANDYIEQDFWSDFKINSYSSDILNLYDENSTDYLNEENNPEKQNGGTLPNYDSYSVLGQGIGGSIEPYIAENGDVYGQSSYFSDVWIGQPSLGNPTLKYNSLNKKFNIPKVDFRFVGEYSNKVENTPGEILNSNGDFSTTASITTGYNNGLKLNANEQKIAGAKNIEWYTNEEIYNGSAQQEGFIDFYENSSDRKLSYDVYLNQLQPEAALPYCTNLYQFEGGANVDYRESSFNPDTYCEYDAVVCQDYEYKSLKPVTYDLKHKIGGFKITNESGITYHYALPVYSYNEYTRTRLLETRENIPEHRESYNREPYAVTWLLTGITGPDFVDQNNNGVLDDSDFGYWVKFDYGLWSDSYQWRTPLEGYTHDIGSNSMTFSYGMKEIYYLDAVETKSHIAIFEKSKRKDGRGVTSRLEGGINPRTYSMVYKDDSSISENDLGYLSYYVAPVAMMKLDAVYLLKKEDYYELNISKEIGTEYREATIEEPHLYPYIGNQIDLANGDQINSTDHVRVSYHNGHKVLDKYDLEQTKEDSIGIISRALRIGKFTHDYSLASGVPNSMDYYTGFTEDDDRYNLEREYPSNPGDLAQGRITTSFSTFNIYDEYNYVARYHDCNVLYNITGTNLPASNGSRLNYIKTGKLTLKNFQVLGKYGSGIIPGYSFGYDKNPDYSSNSYDEWGFYKSDFAGSNQTASISSNRLSNGQIIWSGNLTESQRALVPYSRRVTENSALDVDAWSLTRIKTPNGAEIVIEYESDQYKSVLNNNNPLEIREMTRGSVENEVILELKDRGADLVDLFNVGDQIMLSALFFDKSQTIIVFDIEPNILENVSCIVSKIEDNKVTVINSNLYNQLGVRVIDSTSKTPHYTAGFVLPELTSHYGGGIRVKKMKIEDPYGKDHWTSYDYSDVNGETTGRTSFKPFNSINVAFPVHNDFFYNVLKNTNIDAIKKLENGRNHFQYLIDRHRAPILSRSGLLPSPEVIYGSVEVRSGVENEVLPYKERFYFQTYSPDMITKNKYGNIPHISADISATLEITNKSYSVGNLLKYEKINDQGLLISQTTNKYLLQDEDQLNSGKQGVIEQSTHKNVSFRKYYIKDYDDYGDVQIENENKRVLITKRSDIADVLTSVKQYDYRGIESEEYYLEHDFFSGAVIKAMKLDSYGNASISESIPAYHNYSVMGLSMHGGKNMLTQEALTENLTYVPELSNLGIFVYPPTTDIDPWTIKDLSEELGVADHVRVKINNIYYFFKIKTQNGSQTDFFEIEWIGNSPGVTTITNGIASILDPKISGVVVQTWSDRVPALDATVAEQNNIWRKHRAYSFIGDSDNPMTAEGLLDYTQYEEFTSWNPSDPPPSSKWQKNSEITLYDVYSHALEATDINGNFAATKMDSRQEKVLSTVANASYNQFAYSGAEDLENGSFGGDVALGNGSVESIMAHSGNLSVRCANGQTPFSFLIKNASNRRYRASIWSTSNTVNLEVTGGTVIEAVPVKKAGDWYLHNVDFDAQSPDVNVAFVATDSSYFDDFRVHPIDATMTSYVYNDYDELTHILDANNIYTRYDYDEMGRLEKTYRETFDYGTQLTSNIEYHYGSVKENFTASLDLQSPYRQYEQGELRLNPSYEHPDFRYEWHFEPGGTVFSDTPAKNWTPTTSGARTVFGRVIDTKSGVFSDTDKQTIYISPPCTPYGTWLRDECRYLGGDPCNPNNVGIYADGSCGQYEGPPQSTALCDIGEGCFDRPVFNEN